jgi:hypothetical protein
MQGDSGAFQRARLGRDLHVVNLLRSGGSHVFAYCR